MSSLFLLILFSADVYSQLDKAYDKVSDCVVTKVGDPDSSVPVPTCQGKGITQAPRPTGFDKDIGDSRGNATCPGEGPVTCGTLSEGCHCSTSYQTSVCGGSCSYCAPGIDSASYAIDITNPLNGNVYVPVVFIPQSGESHTVTCKGYDNYGDATDGSEPTTEKGQIIQTLSCADDKTDQPIWMHFHHSERRFPVDIGRIYRSGDVVGKSAAFEVFKSGPHVHFQIGIDAQCESDTIGCKNASQYVQCREQ